jgi:hypothetical protein
MDVDASPLRRLDDDLWVVDQPLGILGIQVGARMTVIRLENGDVLLHSPVTPDAELCDALAEIGPVRHLVAPNKLHHLYFAAAAAAFPEAIRWAAPELAEKRRDLEFDEVLDDTAPAAWAGELDQIRLRGAPYVEEIVFHHRASRTLIAADLAFNVRESHSFITRMFLRANGRLGSFGPSRMFRSFIRDRAAARESLDRMLEWDFDRVVVSHGVVLQSRGRRVLRDAYQWMG